MDCEGSWRTRERVTRPAARGDVLISPSSSPGFASCFPGLRRGGPAASMGGLLVPRGSPAPCRFLIGVVDDRLRVSRPMPSSEPPIFDLVLRAPALRLGKESLSMRVASGGLRNGLGDPPPAADTDERGDGEVTDGEVGMDPGGALDGLGAG
mmetsp:Transcript_8042/g.24182  ORF Transcript_8042/g.24182 Transcript_8042/m.24182 type:complete len:152 (-) Transcript_8042:1187-1642(-)